MIRFVIRDWGNRNNFVYLILFVENSGVLMLTGRSWRGGLAAVVLFLSK